MVDGRLVDLRDYIQSVNQVIDDEDATYLPLEGHAFHNGHLFVKILKTVVGDETKKFATGIRHTICHVRIPILPKATESLRTLAATVVNEAFGKTIEGLTTVEISKKLNISPDMAKFSMD